MMKLLLLKIAMVVLVHHMLLVTCQEKDAKFLILGGGIAGLAAAKNLASKNETDFLILEGDSRLGGRVKSVEFGGKTVEVGAQWLNNDKSQIGELATSANIATGVSDYDSYTIRDSTGTDVTDASDDRYGVFDNALIYMNDLSLELEQNPYKPDVPQRAALALGGWIPREPVDYAIEYYDTDFVFGHQPETASTRFGYIPTLDERGGYMENVVVDQNGGLNQIITGLRDEVFQANDPRYKLNHKVTKITYDDQGVTVMTDINRTYTADYAIVTFSLGVLQNEVVTFDPPLPEWKRYNIMGATFVTDYPIYLKFDTRFWDDTEYILYGSKTRGEYSLWQNFDKLIPGSAILQAQISGPEAKRIARLPTDADVKADIVKVLGDMYKTAIPDPEILIPRWDTDPLHYGTYSDWSPHFPNSSHDALRAPVGRVYFAGEACHRENFGYMEGAYNSAVDETNKLVKCMEDPSECERYVSPYDAVGCTYDTAKNHLASAQIDDGSCTFNKDQTSHGSSGPVISLTLLALSVLFSRAPLPHLN